MTTIGTPQPQYAQIAELVRARIADGTYPRGVPLPSEDRLAEEFGVSRVTINRAIGLLRASGDVKVRRGVGTVVRTLPRITRDVTTRHATDSRQPPPPSRAADSEISGMGLRPRTDYREVGETTPPPVVTRILGITEADRVLVRRRVHYADEDPTEMADSYYPLPVVERCPDLRDVDGGCGGAYVPLAAAGLTPVRFTEDVDVRVPTEEEQRVLDLEPTQVVFHTVHVAYTFDGDPLEVCMHVMPGHLWTLRYGWDDRAEEVPEPTGGSHHAHHPAR